MKTPLLFLMSAGTLLLASCADQPTSASSAASSGAAATRRTETNSGSGGGGDKHEESDKPPFVGMTKGQARSRYGEPYAVAVTDAGEQWTYRLNMGEFVGKHMIPFYFSSARPRIGILTFGTDGRVKTFRWDAPQQG